MNFRIIFLLLLISSKLSAQQPKLVLPIGHTDMILSAEFSHDGTKIVTTSRDKTVKVWDAYTGLLLLDLKGYNDWVWFAEFSRDGKKIVTRSRDSRVKVWDAISGSLLGDFYAFSSYFTPGSAHFSADGKKILVFTGLNKLSVLDATSGLHLLELDAPISLRIDHASTICFSPDQKMILASCGDSTAKIWNAETGSLLLNLQGHQGDINDAAFSPDGKKVVTSSRDSVAKIWDASSGKVLVELKGHTGEILTARFSPDGKEIVTAAADSTARIWDTRSGSLLADLRGHKARVNCAQFAPDGKKILTTSYDGFAKIWDLSSGSLLNDFKSWEYAAHFSPDGKRIVTHTVFGMNTVQVWDAGTGSISVILRGHTSPVIFACFSPDGKKIVTNSMGGPAKIWDDVSGVLLIELKDEGGVSSARFSPDNKKIVTASYDSTAKIWDAGSGQFLRKLIGHRSLITDAQFSPDSKKIVTVSHDTTAKVWDAVSGSLLADLRGHTNHIVSAEFSPDSKKVLTASWDSSGKVWDALTGSLLIDLSFHMDWLNSAHFSTDGKKIVTASTDGITSIWDAVSGKLLTFMASARPVNSAVFSPDGEKVVTATSDDIISLWDAASGKLLAKLDGQSKGLVAAQFSPNGKKIIADLREEVRLWDASSYLPLADWKGFPANAGHLESSVWFSPGSEKVLVLLADNTCRVWSTATGQLLYTFFAIDSTDFFYQIPSGYYKSTLNGVKFLHFVTPDSRVISFEQLDIKYNRPDKVLEGLGNTDTALIRSYRRAWQKRIKKLGIDTASFRDGYSVPEADFANRNEIAYEQKDQRLQLHIKGIDTAFQLDRYNIWVNEVPVYGQRGISIRKKNSNNIDTSIVIKLSPGENRVETSIININGTESYRIPLVVNYTPAVQPKETTHFIGIGIDRFSNDNYNLKYSAKDISDLSVRLKAKYGNAIIIDTLFNENVTIENIKALKQKLQQTTENDKVIIAYSGHGMLSKEYDYYLSTYSVNFENPEQNGLPYDELENLLDSIPARKKLLLIDACHSGEVDKEDLVVLTAKSASLKKGLKPVAYKKEGQLGLANSFELMQSLFVNVGKSTGAVIISAAAGTQFALERGDLQNGVFTYSILEALNKYPTMKISELKKVVSERVEQLTNGLQKPTSRNETIAVDWSIW